MGLKRKLFIGVFGIVFALLLVSSSLLLVVDSTVLNEEFTSDAIEDADAYDELAELANNELSGSEGNTQEVIEDNTIEDVTEENIERNYEFIHGEEDEPSAVIPTDEIDTESDTVRSALRDYTDSNESGLPDTIDLTPEFDQSQMQVFDTAQRAVNIISILTLVLPALAVGLFALFAWRTTLITAGYTGGVVSGLVGGLGIVGSYSVNTVVNPLIEQRIGQAIDIEGATTLAQDLATAYTTGIAGTLQFQSSVLLFLGVVAIGVAVAIQRDLVPKNLVSRFADATDAATSTIKNQNADATSDDTDNDGDTEDASEGADGDTEDASEGADGDTEDASEEANNDGGTESDVDDTTGDESNHTGGPSSSDSSDTDDSTENSDGEHSTSDSTSPDESSSNQSSESGSN